jgi:hypothetical protein
METYLVSEHTSKNNEIVDPEIKIKARVFHYWAIYAQKRLLKKQEKSNLEGEIQRITIIHHNNLLSFSLRVWNDLWETKKYVTQIS